MINVEENQLKKCIFMDLDEFEEAAGRALSIFFGGGK